MSCLRQTGPPFGLAAHSRRRRREKQTVVRANVGKSGGYGGHSRTARTCAVLRLHRHRQPARFLFRGRNADAKYLSHPSSFTTARKFDVYGALLPIFGNARCHVNGRERRYCAMLTALIARGSRRRQQGCARLSLPRLGYKETAPPRRPPRARLFARGASSRARGALFLDLPVARR
jgi:hypothetical protein